MTKNHITGVLSVTTIITEKVYEEQQKNERISKFFQTFEISKAVKASGFYKRKGTSPVVLLKYVFSLVFRNSNIYLATRNNSSEGKSKNTIYRFLNSKAYNWGRLLYSVALNLIAFLLPLTSEQRENVLIVDDTLYSRSRSKKVDMLSKVYDHNTNKYVKGFKLLTLAWSDGNTTVPFAYQPMVSTNEKMIINSIPENLDKRTREYRLRKAAQTNPVDAMFSLLDKTNLSLLKVKYLLFDSWFAFPSVIMKARQYGLDVVCMLKRMYRVYYTYKGKNYNLKDLYNHVPHNRRGEIIASVKVKIHNQENQEAEAKIVFLRSNKKNDDWIALLSTNVDLDDKEIIRIYAKRWNIEVLFKISKHYLKLDTELESRSFESLYAHCAIVFLRYMMLAYESRISEDERTCGELFFLICNELRDISYLQALVILLNVVFTQAGNEGVLDNAQITHLISIFISTIPLFIWNTLDF